MEARLGIFKVLEGEQNLERPENGYSLSFSQLQEEAGLNATWGQGTGNGTKNCI